eukprot:1235925-Pleurochrysis_carterae.AAC.1
MHACHRVELMFAFFCASAESSCCVFGFAAFSSVAKAAGFPERSWAWPVLVACLAAIGAALFSPLHCSKPVL